MPTYGPIALYNNFSAQNPVTIKSTGTVVGNPGTLNGDAVYGANYPWGITNYGTAQGSGSNSSGAAGASTTRG
jgi:hypothetical protein